MDHLHARGAHQWMRASVNGDLLRGWKLYTMILVDIILITYSGIYIVVHFEVISYEIHGKFLKISMGNSNGVALSATRRPAVMVQNKEMEIYITYYFS